MGLRIGVLKRQGAASTLIYRLFCVCVQRLCFYFKLVVLYMQCCVLTSPASGVICALDCTSNVIRVFVLVLVLFKCREPVIM